MDAPILIPVAMMAGFIILGVILSMGKCSFLIAGYNGTAYYPSCSDLQSSLTISNSCSSEFTLSTMAWVSLAIPFVLAYIFFAWRAIDRRRLTRREMEITEDKY